MSDMGRAAAESFKVGFEAGQFRSWSRIIIGAIAIAILAVIAWNTRAARIVVDTKNGYRCEQSCGGTYMYCKKL